MPRIKNLKLLGVLLAAVWAEYVLMHIQLRVLECLGLNADGGERDKNCMCLKVPSCPKNVYLVRTTV